MPGLTIEEKYNIALRLIKQEYAENGTLYMAAILRLLGEPYNWNILKRQFDDNLFDIPEVDAMVRTMVEEQETLSLASSRQPEVPDGVVTLCPVNDGPNAA